VVNTLIDEKWLKLNQKCNNNNPFAVNQVNDSYVDQPFGCGCYFKAIELNATSWDRDSVNGTCRFFSETCDKVAAPNFEAGDIIVDVSYCSEPCASGSDLSHSQCGTLDNFIALNGTEYNIFGCVQAQVFSHAQGATKIEHIWFGEDIFNSFTTEPFPVGENFLRNGSNMTLLSALHACETEQCPTSTTTTTTTTSTETTQTTITGIACNATNIADLINEGKALENYGCKEPASEYTVVTTGINNVPISNLCGCAEFAYQSSKSFMYTLDNQCRLYQRECTIVKSTGSYALNFYLFQCFHGCRALDEPAVRYTQCNNGNPSVMVTSEGIGCVQPENGPEQWMWPNATAPNDATGALSGIPQLRVDGTQVFRVCNGPCNRQALVTCAAGSCNPNDQAITENECAQSAPELYYELEVGSSVPECQSTTPSVCVRGTASHATLNQDVRWQAFLHCTGTKSVSDALADALEDQSLTSNQPYEAACASCNPTLTKRECSPRQSVRSKAVCDVMRKAQALPPPLRTNTNATPVGCFLQSSEHGQMMIWQGVDEYPVDLQDTPPNLSERMCKSVWNTYSDEPAYMLAIQTSGTCETSAARGQCPGSSQTPSSQYAYAGCRELTPGKWQYYNGNLLNAAPCTRAVPCLCAERLGSKNFCYNNAPSCTELADHLGILQPLTQTPGSMCKFENGRLVTVTNATGCVAAPLLNMQVVPSLKAQQLMKSDQCQAIANSAGGAYATSTLSDGYCNVEDVNGLLTFNLQTSTSDQASGLAPIDASARTTDCAFIADISDCSVRASNAVGIPIDVNVVYDNHQPTGCVIDSRAARTGATGVPQWNAAGSAVKCTNAPQWSVCVCGFQSSANPCPQVLPASEDSDSRAFQILIIVIAGLSLILVFTSNVRQLPAVPLPPPYETKKPLAQRGDFFL